MLSSPWRGVVRDVRAGARPEGLRVRVPDLGRDGPRLRPVPGAARFEELRERRAQGRRRRRKPSIVSPERSGGGAGLALPGASRRRRAARAKPPARPRHGSRIQPERPRSRGRQSRPRALRRRRRRDTGARAAARASRRRPASGGASWVELVPLSGAQAVETFTIVGQPTPPGKHPEAEVNVLGGGFFRVMGIPLAAGREFDDAVDRPGASAVVMINEAMARRWWPGSQPGRRAASTGRRAADDRGRQPRLPDRLPRRRPRPADLRCRSRSAIPGERPRGD